MDIKLKNKFLYFDKYKLRCSIGKRGITSNKKEGDEKTPKGKFKLKYIFYIKDRIQKLKTRLKKRIIRKNMGWCDDTNSKFYNKLVNLPFKESAERLWLRSKIYDIIVIIDYNFKTPIKNKGSAIFLHIAKNNYSYTKGCIAINKKDMLFLISKIKNKTKLIIR